MKLKAERKEAETKDKLHFLNFFQEANRLYSKEVEENEEKRAEALKKHKKDLTEQISEIKTQTLKSDSKEEED